MDVEEIIASQKDLDDKIKVILTNYKKDGASRKDSREYFEKRITALQALYEQFQLQHTQLISIHAEALLNTEYYKQRFHEVARNNYENCLEKLQRGLEEWCYSQRKEIKGTGSKQISESRPEEVATSKASSSLNIAIKKQRRLMEAILHYIDDINDQCRQTHQKAYYTVKREFIRRKWEEIDQNNDVIWSVATNSEPEGYSMQQYLDCEGYVQNTLIILEEQINKQQHNLNNCASTPNIKLPKVVLPIFNGDYLKWTSFKDLFSTLIHDAEMSNAQKMYYLISNLSGEAKTLVQHLTITEDNYDDAWTILKTRYDNNRLLVTAWLNRLLSQPTISSEGPQSLRMLHDTTKECLSGIVNLGIPTRDWDPLLVHILIKKLDRTTHQLFEQRLENPRDLPSLDTLLKFIESRFQALEALGKERRVSNADNISKVSPRYRTALSITNDVDCLICPEKHHIFNCKAFLKQSLPAKLETVKRLKLCYNCLKKGHSVQTCPSRNCTKCHKRHNTLLHSTDHQSQTAKSKQGTSNKLSNLTASPHSTANEGTASTVAASSTQTTNSQILLSTAIVNVSDIDGNDVSLRAVLDVASQINLISTEAVQRLRLPTNSTQMYLNGVGKIKDRSHQRINVKISSRTSSYTAHLDAFVLHQVVSDQPAHYIDRKALKIPNNIILADPNFDKPSKVDLLIGAEFFYDVLIMKRIKLGKNEPILQNTVFGWVVGGKSPSQSFEETDRTCAINTIENINLQDSIERFWKIEDTKPATKRLTQEEKQCEEHFQTTFKRSSDGRFIVKLPFSKDPSCLGDSRRSAIRRFLQLERKLLANSEINIKYRQILQEYEDLGYIARVPFPDPSINHHFVPHFYVEKPDSISTSIRPVFDFSATTENNVSLNSILMNGATQHPELFTVLLRFRLPRFVFSADIKQMYLRIHLDENDRCFQLIVYRKSPEEPLQCYEIRSVAFGTKPAPYQATRCLKQLSIEKRHQYSLGCKMIDNNFYVDDGMAGADSLTEALEMQQQIQQILQSAGFQLRKWCANNAKLLENIPVEYRALQLEFNELGEENQLKALGLIWIPYADELKVKVSKPKYKRVTKRTVLSDISSLFDPLGLVSPVILRAKLFMQELWKLKLGWDETLPTEYHEAWIKFREDLENLHDVRFPRHLFGKRVPVDVQIHTFADASMKAYGAAVYIRASYKDGTISTQLLCGKSKVAPTSGTTLPRLELCAALLAAELNDRIKQDLNLTKCANFLWSDSTITLDWINSQPALHQTFVANRIASIQQLSSAKQWNHVPSEQNPADILSRGATAIKFKDCHLWAYGPLFLYGPETKWPNLYKREASQYERKQTKQVLVMAVDSHTLLEQINHGNSLMKLNRIIAYCLRLPRTFFKATKTEPQNNLLTTEELAFALTKIIVTIQADTFGDELKQLKKHSNIPSSSHISSLSPFIDENGVLRVGGRIQSSTLTYEAKHPTLLPYNHWFTRLVLDHIHKTNKHVGAQALLHITRQKYWPIKGKTMARNITNKCIICARRKPKTLTQIMGNLPEARVQPARPFVNTGVDFAGPIYTHYKVRGKKPQKTYIAVFCCFATKAVHLELVTDLSTNAFIAALKRFTSRRGNCSKIYCDNATNFVGAKNQLGELYETIYSSQAEKDITFFCHNKGITFSFIPPRSPHFGGLWEAAVKSAKGLLRKHIGEASLTYEELETVIVEIEAVLNSRPLTPMSDDPNDLTALTPGHFLIGEPLTSTIDSQASENNKTLGHRYEILYKIKHDFWKRWSAEYLSSLQQRHKWKTPRENLKTGALVLIKEDNLPVLKWVLGRVTKVIEGEDGFVRVADVKTSSGVLRRPIHKLALLPMEADKASHEQPSNEETSSSNEFNSKDCEPPSKRKRSNSKVNVATTLLLTTMLATTMGTQAIKITPHTKSPGAIFERMGMVNMINNEWTLIIYYNMSTFWGEFNTMSAGVNQLRDICTRGTDKYCNTTTDHFIRQLEYLREQGHYLRQNNTTIRRKRGALNIVGNVANALFGVLDSDYAQRMESTINNLRGNDEQILELVKNQTSVIDNTIQLMEHTQLENQKHFEEINRFIKDSNQVTSMVGEELHQQKLDKLYNQAATRLLLMMENYRRLQDSFLQMVIDSHHGKINPSIITPDQLTIKMRRITDNLPSSLRLPPVSSILELYSLITIETGITPTCIIFKLKIPLVTYERFELLHIVPVPWIQDGKSKMISIEKNYLIVDMHRDQYYALNDQELALCTISNTLQYMCKQHHLMFRASPKSTICELDILIHGSSLTNCRVIEVNNGPRWIQLFQRNHWLYVTFKQTVINIICSEDTYQKTLYGTGIIEIDDDCIIKDEFTTIQPHKLYASSFKTSFVASTNNFNFSKLPEIAEINRDMTTINNLSDEYSRLHSEVNGLKEAERSVSRLQYHDVHQYTIGYISLGLGIAAIVFLCFKLRKSTPPPITTTDSATSQQSKPSIATSNVKTKASTKNLREHRNPAFTFDLDNDSIFDQRSTGAECTI